MDYCAEERETIILTNDSLDYWEIESFQRKICTKVRKIKNVEIIKETTTENGTVVYGKYKLSFNQLSFRNLRELSEEQSEKLSERMKSIREERKSNER